MKVTIDWLKQYVDFSYSTEELSHHLTMLGLEVESVKQFDYDFENVIIGEVDNVKQHETKESLKICDVNIGNETLSLVCGAPNVKKGLKVPVAIVGAKLPKDKLIKSSVIHGHESSGMICSAAELGLSNQSDIIMELNNNASVGQNLIDYLGEPETVIEIDLTPNRPDCLGAIGIAREIATLNNSKLSKPEIHLVESDSSNITDKIEVILENSESCPRYTARYIEGIEVKSSPRWLAKKLEAVGLRSINNVVDVTNYVMMETGQPLHAFDYDLLDEQKIVVRHAEQNEKFITLDEKEHELSNQNLLICDGKKPIALAGVMGGLNSEVSEKTKNVLLESALFDPLNIRKTARSLSISTDSSQRFERGVDPEGLIYALNRATQLINELAGGTVAKNYIDCYPSPKKEQVIKLRRKRVNDLLGTKLNLKTINSILEKLEFKTTVVEDNNVLSVNIPSFRVDIEREADLIEEISRIYGFDKIKEKTYSKVKLQTEANRQEHFREILRNFFVRLGYHEIVTYSLLNSKLAEQFSANVPIPLKNPISEDLNTLRTSLIPGILQVIKWNKNRKIKNQKLFEIGNIFYFENKNSDSHKEVKRLILALTGDIRQHSWVEKSRPSNYFDLKGDLHTLIQECGFDNIDYKTISTIDFFQAEVQTNLLINDKHFGSIGAISEDILKDFDIEDDIYIADLDFQMLFNHFQWDKKSKQISKYPEVKRDLALVVDQLVTSEKVEQLIRKAGGKNLIAVDLFDLYQGRQIKPNQKSFAYSLKFQSPNKTLTEKEIDSVINKMLKLLKSEVGASLRK